MSNPNVHYVTPYDNYTDSHIVVVALKYNALSHERHLGFSHGFNPNLVDENYFRLPDYITSGRVAKTNISFRDTTTGKFVSYKQLCEEHNLTALAEQMEQVRNLPDPDWYR